MTDELGSSTVPAVRVLYALGTGAAAILIYWLGAAFYNAYLHPASKFPGPKLWSAFYVFKDLTCARGDIDNKLIGLHAKYGPVVRISPDELSFVEEQAWRDIYAHPNYLAKWPKFAFALAKPDTPADIIQSTHPDHARIRRQFSHAFSEKALKEQEDLITSYVDLLMARLTDAAADGTVIDIVKWYNFTTFDIISDLAFGESFHSLKTGAYHPWVSSIFKNIRTFSVIQSFATYPGAKIIIGLLASADMRQSRKIHLNYSRTTVLKRLSKGTLEERKDFISYALKHKDEDEQGVSEGEIIRTASTFIMAGSETTATLLSGVTYLLSLNADARRKVTEEVRTAFQAESDINFTTAPSRLTYMQACLDEALRLYPPAPFLSPRLTPPGITEIAGHQVPGGMGVGVARLAAARSPDHFHESGSFHPERWLDSATKNPMSPFYNDARGSFQSFLLGPGACLGKNLAYHEMRTIFSRILWRFDIEVCAESSDWMKGQKTFVVWDKPALMCKLKAREL